MENWHACLLFHVDKKNVFAKKVENLLKLRSEHERKKVARVLLHVCIPFIAGVSPDVSVSDNRFSEALISLRISQASRN